MPDLSSEKASYIALAIRSSGSSPFRLLFLALGFIL